MRHPVIRGILSCLVTVTLFPCTGCGSKEVEVERRPFDEVYNEMTPEEKADYNRILENERNNPLGIPGAESALAVEQQGAEEE